MFGSSVLNETYQVGGVSFRVLGIIPYTVGNVSKRYEEILKFPSGLLIAIAYRGTLIPNITLKGGVVCLTKVEVKGEVYKTPKTISETLKIEEAMYPYDLLKN